VFYLFSLKKWNIFLNIWIFLTKSRAVFIKSALQTNKISSVNIVSLSAFREFILKKYQSFIFYIMVYVNFVGICAVILNLFSPCFSFLRKT